MSIFGDSNPDPAPKDKNWHFIQQIFYNSSYLLINDKIGLRSKFMCT
jgi:hypothetical protein